MKIAYVRGAFLNPFEFQLYAPLAERHELIAIGADWQFYQQPVAFPGVRVKKAALWATALAPIWPASPIVFNRSLSWTTGRSYGLLGLESLVERPDILHSSETFFSMTFQSLLLKRRLGCKLVVTVNENLPHMGETHPLRRRRKHEVMREADLFIAITSNTRNMLVEEGIEPGRIEIVSSSIDLERFKPAPKDERLLSRLGLRKEDCVVLFVGRFVEEKGIREMLEAHRILRGKNSSLPVRWCFVGAGPLLGLLQKARAAFPSDIVLPPFVPYEQIHSLHQIADIFTLPSKPAYKVAEQFGYVLAESMACQKA